MKFQLVLGRKRHKFIFDTILNFFDLNKIFSVNVTNDIFKF